MLPIRQGKPEPDRPDVRRTDPYAEDGDIVSTDLDGNRSIRERWHRPRRLSGFVSPSHPPFGFSRKSAL
jgi:hypothetical protein